MRVDGFIDGEGPRVGMRYDVGRLVVALLVVAAGSIGSATASSCRGGVLTHSFR
jgi:hypothetical protein